MSTHEISNLLIQNDKPISFIVLGEEPILGEARHLQMMIRAINCREKDNGSIILRFKPIQKFIEVPSLDGGTKHKVLDACWTDLTDSFVFIHCLDVLRSSE